jgi:mannan endo-1,4-beta-mannosidase
MRIVMELGIVFLEPLAELNGAIDGISNRLAGKPAYGWRFVSFEDDFPLEICNEFRKHELTPILTWEFYFPSSDGHNRRTCTREETHLKELLEGKFDTYINDFASHVKQWKDTVFLRILHEFNAGWYVWGGEKNGGADGGPELVKRCWIYLVDKFREQNVDNVRWLWCVHEPSVQVSLEEWNQVRNYWPGHDYVDALCMDGFNFYPENPEREHPEFMDFETLFSEMYKQVTALSAKPVFIMTGTSEFSRKGGISRKADWINDAFAKIRNIYTHISVVSWFHYKFNDKINWRIDSSKEHVSKEWKRG